MPDLASVAGVGLVGLFYGRCGVWMAVRTTVPRHEKHPADHNGHGVFFVVGRGGTSG